MNILLFEKWDQNEFENSLRWFVNGSMNSNEDDLKIDFLKDIKSKSSMLRTRAVNYIRERGGILYRASNNLKLNTNYEIKVCDSFSTNPAVPIRLSNNNLIIAIPYTEIESSIVLAISIELSKKYWYDPDTDEEEIWIKGPLTIDKQFIRKQSSIDKKLIREY
jgi:hypothetical protein